MQPATHCEAWSASLAVLRACAASAEAAAELAALLLLLRAFKESRRMHVVAGSSSDVFVGIAHVRGLSPEENVYVVLPSPRAARL